MKQRNLILILLLVIIASLGFAQTSRVTLNEDFEGTFPPSGWTINGWTQSTLNPHGGTYDARCTNTGNYMISPLMAAPGVVQYYHRKATGNVTFTLATSPNLGGPWTTVSGYPIFAGNGWSTATVDLSGLTNVYVRWIANGDNTFYIDDISIAGATIPAPSISLTGTLASFGLIKVGNNSTPQSYNVSGSNMTANLLITAPTGYQVSTSSGSGYGSTVTLTPVSGTIASTPIYVRFTPGTTGVISGNITHTSTDATQRDQAVTGTGIDNPVIGSPTSASITSVNAILGGDITNINFSNVTERGIYYSTTNGFADGTGTKVSETGTYGTGIYTLLVNGLTPGVTYYYKAFATNAAGTSYTTQASFGTPAITVTASLVNFGLVKVGSTSSEQSYGIAGINLTADLIVTAPAGFQISATSGGSFGTSLTYTPSAGIVTASIFVRFAPTGTGAASGNISHASTSATTQTLAVAGTGINNPVISTPTSASITSTTAVLGGNITSINFSNVIERGIYYSTTNGFADGTGTKVSSTGTFGTGVFTESVNGLTKGTTYYFKAFATNAAGTSYTTQGTFGTPGINAVAAMANFGLVKVGNYSTQQSFTVAGVNLTADLVVTPPAGYEVSVVSGSGFGSSVSMTPISGTVPVTTVYIRFAPGTTGVIGGNVSLTSTATTTETITVSGTGINNPVVSDPTSASITSISAVLGGNITNVNFSNVTERGIYYSTSSGFADGTGTKVSETGTFGTGLFTLNVTGLNQGITYYFKAFATNAAGTSYTTQASFITPAVFTAESIEVTQSNPSSGTVRIGTVLSVEVTDLLNGTPSQFQIVTCDFSQFGGPDSVPMVRTTNLPLNGIWTAAYTVLPGNLEVFNSAVSVTVSNYSTVEDDEEFAVNNWLDVPDILSSCLQVNNDPLDTTFKIGDTIHLKLTLKSYVDSVWVNWGSAFTGAPTLGYKAIAGAIDAAYTPVAGQLTFTPNLTILIPRMKSNNGFYTYSIVRTPSRMLPFSKSVSLTLGGAPVMADLVIPVITGGKDLFYDTDKPLRFSPIIAGVDGYTTLPNTFAIRFYVPEWGTPGGTASITLQFEAESRAIFTKTFTGAEVETIEEEETRDVYQQIIWDGKDNFGNYVANLGVSKTMGITIIALSDSVGNNAVLTHILGPEYSPTGVEDEATHFDISTGVTILNRIHVAVDDLQPSCSQNFNLVNTADAHLVRIINDTNYNSAYDAGESVLYTDSTSPVVNNNNVVELAFRSIREYTVDSNPLRHESQNYWVVVEQTGTANKWYFDGANWVSLAGFDQYEDSLPVTFPSTGSINASTNSNLMTLAWDTSNLVTFPGSDPGITYALYAYIQDNAGNIMKSETRNVVVENRYIQLPIITDIEMVSQHVSGPGYFPAETGGINNYYLTAAYGPSDLPYTGNYYVTRDTLKIEFTINDKNFLRTTQSVFVDLPAGFGVADFYINKADFNASNKYTKIINVSSIASGAGSLLPGTVWTISGDPVSANNIQVLAYPPITVFSGSVPAEDDENFRLVIPAKPVFPTTNVADYHLAATPSILSPGNPLFTYDSDTNPANDNLKDDTNFSFTIPLTTTNVNWTLRLETQDAVPVVFNTWTGTLTPAETPYTPSPFNWAGLKEDFTLAVPITSTQLLNLKLIVQPEGYADPGYLAPPSEITPVTVVKVDNTKPTFVDGSGVTINPVTGMLTLATGTPIVTETENQMLFTLYTSEPLPATISTTPGLGWQVEVRDSLGAILMNGPNPVTATINTIIPANGNVTAGYQTFAFTVTVNNIAGDFTRLKPVLVVKSPWDAASNPGRYNNPPYPYNADVYHSDATESYLTFNILNAKPKITQIDFTHRSVTGTAKYSGSTWNPQFTQGWVNSGSPNTFTLTATITGGMYRSLYSKVSADLSAFITGDTADTTAVVTAPAGSPNEARVWTATWTKNITAALANAWTDNQVLSIPITITTQDGSQPAVHVESGSTKFINIKVDKVNPTISSSTYNLVANGTPQNFVFNIADPTPGSGINWATASLVLSPNNGVTIGTGSNGTWPVTIPTNSAIKYMDATVSVSDYMGNSFTYHRYVNVVPVPALSNMTLTTVNSGEVSNAYFVPGRNLTAAFTVTNPERVKRLVVTLSAPGVTILNNVQTISSGISGSMSVVFNGVTTSVPTDLDGKVITATVTGVTDAYIAPISNATEEINLTGSGLNATINVDTKPVITSTTFYYNNVVTNTLLKNMTNVKIVAVVSNVNPLNTTTNPMTITMQNVTGTFTLPTPVVTTASGTTTYTWNNVTLANLNWSPASDYKVAAFKFNCRTIYGYQAAERTHEMAVLSDRTNQIYGVVNARTPYAGVDPDGWFAPEHLLKVDYTFISAIDQALPPIRANFDQIEDNLQDNWTAPSNLSTKTPIVITVNQGGVPVTVTVYKYLARWSVQPDVQSVWNAYEDGAAAPVYFKYTQYTFIGEIDDTRSIQVDKKVPVYDKLQLWVAVKSTTPASGDYQFINNGFNRPTTLALQTNGSWVTGNNIYVKYRAKDSVTGIGVTEIYTPANPTGWTASNVSQTDLGSGVVEKVVQLTPTNPASISASTQLALTLAKVEDKVGHVNYGLPVNSTDPNWTQSGPVLNFTFSANYITNLRSLEAFQVIGGNYTDNKTKPYVKAGQPLGVTLKLAPLAARGVDVQSITVSNVKINTKWITSVGGTGADNFVTMTYRAADSLYYLNSAFNVNSAYAHGAGITLQYQINYTITYTDATTSTQQYTSGAIPDQAFVENNSPVLKDVFVWSNSLGQSQDGYVVPLDSEGTVKVIFEEQAGYANPTTKPSVQITNLNVFLAGMPTPYNVLPAEITFYPSYSITVHNIVKNYTNVWVADITRPVIMPSPVVTSTEIGYTIADVVGNPSISGDRFVEIAANGPLVPIIRFAELVTTLPESQVVSNYMAQTVPAQLKIYSDVAEIAYIEDAWATPITGINFGSFSVAPTTLHNSRFVITIPVTPVNVNNISPIDSIMITVNTKRNPFGGAVFYDSETFGVRVDGEMFNLVNPSVVANSIYGDITGMINPAVQTTITAQVNDIGELIRNRGLATLPTNANMTSWFVLQNNTPATFITIPAPVVTGTGNGRTVTWTIPSADIDPAILTATAPMSVKIGYRDIYGLTKTQDDITFNVDKVAPVFAANGIKFFDTHTATPTLLQENNYTNPGWITNSLDWDKVRFTFEDPIIRTGVNGSGVHGATVTMTRENETYPTPALTNLNAVIVDANSIELQFVNGFSANELAEGYYNFNIHVVDNIENGTDYTQRFWYGFAPATLLIQPGNNMNLNVSSVQQQVSAITGDPQGQINGVDFHLYFDSNNDGTYQAGTDPDYTSDITSDDGNPDMVVPFDVMWNLTNRNHYAYLVDPVYGANPTRKFLLRASIISQNRSVTDSIVVVNVTDDQPAVPDMPWFTGNTTFDYLHPANNVLTFTTRFVDWPDARRVRFEVTKVGDPTVHDTLGVELANPTDYASVQWNFSGRTPGDYNVVAYGRDVVGNWSAGVPMTTPIRIYDPASLVTYNMEMWNVQGYGDPVVQIPSGTIYGANHPASTIGDLRLDVRFDSLFVHSQNTFNYLSGVSAITFKAVIRNNITGAETTVDVPNNTALQPDYPAIGSIAVTPQIMNIPVRIFVPDSFFMPSGFDSNDYSYNFFIQLTPTNPAVLQPPSYQTLRFDYFAPRVAITSNTPHITWSKDNQFTLQDSVLVGNVKVLKNDVSDISNITLLWSDNNGTTWHNAVANLVNNPAYLRFENWVTRGGSVSTLLYNYEGDVSLKVRAMDAMGNPRESDAIRAYVDNKAPSVPISQAAYSTVDQNQIVQSPYTALHTIGTLPNEAGNTITAVASSGTYGTSILQLRTNQNNITGLSQVAIGPQFAEWYTTPGAAWYTNNNDLRPPVIMYHGFSANGNEDEIMWTPGELFDHEADNNGNYGFDVDFRAWSARYSIPISGTHYFIFAAKDSRGNMEGDYADTLGTQYDGMLSNLEKKNAIDLRVNVINVSDVEGQIVSHVDNQIVSEYINLAADITGNAYNVNVNQVRFERKVGENWMPISTVNRAGAQEARPVMFHLYRSDIPQFDGLPYVPGVHLYANGSFVRELTWNQDDLAWADTVSFVQGSYDFQYKLDLNNDGIIDGLDSNFGVNNVVSDPNGFTHFNVTPWITYLDTRNIPIGLYEFRALPLTAQGDVLFNKVAPSRWLVIDNTAPATTMTVVGAINRIQPHVEFGMVADVNELLVASDDIVDVTYQYASQPQLNVWLNNQSFRHWNNIETSSEMDGNYAISWEAPDPAFDLVDNDNDGLIDELDEQDAIFYLRAIAKDKAGNYFTSNVYQIYVDGSAPTMTVNALNGVVMSSTNNIFSIPATGDITVSAVNSTPTFFDNPVTTQFMVMYKASQNATWSGWQFIDGPVTVVDGAASVVIPRPANGYLEGYYGFKTVSTDALGNTDANPAITYVVYDDITGSNIHLTRVGNVTIYSEAYGFAQHLTDYQGSIYATLDNPADVNTVTYEYAMSVNGPWININTMSINGQANVSTHWNIPTGVRAPFVFLRVTAQDINGNNQNSQTVKLYVDTTSPSLVVNSLSHIVVNNKKVIDPYNPVWINVSYTNLPDVGVVDVKGLTLRLVGPNSVSIVENYQNVGQASVDFEITEQQLAGLADGIYTLEAIITDFAGNVTITDEPIVPVGYEALYIDRVAPANLSIYSTTHPNNQAPYNSNVTFRINYTDLIGIPAADAMTATFNYQNASDTVNNYTVNEQEGYIEFVWNPSAAFEQYLIDGLENIVVSANISVNDYLYSLSTFSHNEDHIATVPNTSDFFALTYGIPANVRMMAVTDVVKGNRVTHFVNWNLANPQVVEQLGTNHTPGAEAAPLTLFAYVPHQAEIPQSMEFSYRKQGTTGPWNTIGTLTQGTEWNFVDPSFNNMFQRQYSMDWNIVNLLGGVYEVKTTSTYLAGQSESTILVDIYNSDLIPMPVVNGMVNGNVERGNTYPIGVARYAGNASYVDMVRYQYRYVSNAGNVITPLSQWSYFGELDGTQMPNWIPAPYTYNWSVYPYYLYNNDVQIVGYAKDKWGTETPITSIIQNNSYVLAHITDTIAPAVNDITVKWNGITNPAWLSGMINQTATVKAHIVSNINPSDIVRVEFLYNDVLIQTETGYPVNNQPIDFWTQTYDFAVPASGNSVDILTVKTYDVYNNVSMLTTQLNIDNTIPTADFMLTMNGQPITVLEREADILLNANAADITSGVSQVSYAYRMVGANAWTQLNTVTSAPFTYEWTVPADLEWGAQYEFQAIVTDNVGHTLTVTHEPYEVSDVNTQIMITSVAGHTPVNHIIPFRVHGNFDVLTNVVEGQNIPRLEFLVRTITNSNWRTLESPYITAINDYSANFNLNSLASGNYYLGVAPHSRLLGAPVDSVMITLDNAIGLTGVSSDPATNGSFNGSEFTVNFSIGTDDEINPEQIELQYAYPIDPENWISLGFATTYQTQNGIAYSATFNDINITHQSTMFDGYYNFRVAVRDNALPMPNIATAVVANNVLYDTMAPSVMFTSINNNTDMTMPISIELGSNANLLAAAFDVLGGQIHQVASGIESVTFSYQFGEINLTIGEDTSAPYSINWNTLGYQLGDYTLKAVAVDNAGNESEYTKLVSIVAPSNLQPYAVITAMSFNANSSNQDYIFAVTKDWPGVQISGVSFEYYNGTTWLEFAQATQQDGYWKAPFNAELMTSAQKIRTYTTYNIDQISSVKPQLNVTFSPLEGGSFVTTTQVQTPIYYQDKLNITGVTSMPIVTTLFDGNFVNMPLVQIVNGDYEAGFVVNAHGKYTFYTSVLDNLGNIQLAKNELKTFNVGTGTSNDNVISAPVPANSYLYFENVKSNVALTEGYRLISQQKAAIANMNYTTGGDRALLNITMTLNALVNAQGTIVGMYYDGSDWRNCPAEYNAMTNKVTFEAPSGYIYAVAQYADVTINATFVEAVPNYTDQLTSLYWTTANPLLKFFVYDDVNEGGYESPDIDEITYSMYVDSLLVDATYNNGFITYSPANMTAGQHLVRVVVVKNGFTSIAQKVFNVDVTVPVIVPIAGQINSDNLVVSATITDIQTGIKDVTMTVNTNEGWYGNNLVVPFERLTVNNDVYSYTLSLDELYNLGYHCNSTHTMRVNWEASNNLDMSAVACSILYTVNIEGPSIVFTGFEDGWWLNPTHSTPLTFDVIASEGRTIPADGVEVAVYEVTPLSNDGDDIQYMTLAPVSVEGNVYHYTLSFGQLLSPEATAVRLNVIAEDNYNVDNESEQTYGIDYSAPVMYAMSPVGAPIDNDGDGLFNEDSIDGINQDQDWDDWDHDGIWDDGVHHFSDNGDIEPPIIDEDPVDFAPAVLQYGTDVSVSFAFNDFQGFHFLMPYATWYYTGASGIDPETVSVTLNGTPVEGIVTNGTFIYHAGVQNAGHYTVAASVSDFVGNTGGLSFTYDVIGGAPSVTFIEPENGWWLNSNNNNTLSFTVQTQSTVQEIVVANVYTIPGNTLIQGPSTMSPTEGVYNVQLLGGLIPSDQIGVRLEVVINNVFGQNSTSNQSYGIDNSAPVINILSPLANAEFEINTIVNIAATISDQVVVTKAGGLTLNKMTKADGLTLNSMKSAMRENGRPSGSGITNVTLCVIDPSGESVINEVYPYNTQIIEENLNVTSYGTYHVNVKAVDGAGNQGMASVNFIVPAPAPEISFMPFAASGWNYSQVNNEAFHFVINATGNVPVSNITATFYAMPENTVIQGPNSVAVHSDNDYYVTLGASIPPLATGVRLEVKVMNNLGGEMTASQTYNVDGFAPVITFQYPENASQVTLINEQTKINIRAIYNDNAVAKIVKQNRTVGSGIANALLVVLNPSDEIVLQKTTGADTTEVNASVQNLRVGTYTIRLSVWDKAGNKAMASITVDVVSPIAPPTELEIADAHMYPNPAVSGSNSVFYVEANNDASIKITIYDFAGRQVRELMNCTEVKADAPAQISWDGRNSKGDKLARGSYFARIIANDGQKIVEKVVKVAIQ